MKRNKNRTEDGHRSLERRLSLLNDSLQLTTNQVFLWQRFHYHHESEVKLHENCSGKGKGVLIREVSYFNVCP